MKVFVAGASGLVGRALIGVLKAARHEVSGTTREPEKAETIRALGATPVIVDAYDREGLASALRAERPDAVIHQLTDLRRMDLAANARLRIEGTRNLVDAARAVGVRRMVTQSIAFVYAPGDGLADEEEPLYLDAPEPWRETVTSVAAMERAAAELPEGVILRYGLLYGPDTAFAADGAMAEQARRGALAANENVTSFLHVDDAALTARLALDWPPGIYNIVDDEPALAATWLPRYAAAVGGPPPMSVAGRDALMSRGAFNQKARRARGWVPLHASWRAGLVEALA